MNEALQQVEDDDDRDVEIELDDAGNDDFNPNIADQLDNAPNDNPIEDKRTAEERILAFLEEDEELKEYGDGVQKRINKLTYNWREAERREQAAIAYAEGVKREIEQLRVRQQESDGVFINEYKGRVEAQLAQAKQNLKAAYEAGDAELIAEANTNIARFSAELANAEQTESRYRRRAQQAPQQFTQPNPQQFARPNPQFARPQQPPRPDPKAETWAERNTWFGEDRVMTDAALSIHRELVTEEGYTPDSDEYYAEVDKRIRRNFPHKFQQPAKPQQASSVTPSASNAVAKRGKRNVKLSASQVAMAKRLGVSLEEYAKYV